MKKKLFYFLEEFKVGVAFLCYPPFFAGEGIFTGGAGI